MQTRTGEPAPAGPAGPGAPGPVIRPGFVPPRGGPIVFWGSTWTDLKKWAASYRPPKPPRRTLLNPEVLEERAVPAGNTLHWQGAANANWSAAGSWQEGIAPVSGNGDILVFDNTKDSASNDDMANLSIGGLQITGAFTSEITIERTGLTVTGDVSLAGGKLSGGPVNVPNAASNITWSGGTINDVVTLGSDGVNPTLTVNGNVNLNGTLDSYATATWTSGDITFNNGTYRNESGATLDAQSNNIMTNNAGTPVFTNLGTFKKSNGAGTTTVAVAFTNAGGNFLLQSGTVSLTAPLPRQTSGLTELYGGSLNINTPGGYQLSGGLLDGVGTITGRGVNNSGGSVTPGINGGPGILNIVGGGYTQGPGGILVINIDGGGNAGVLNVQNGDFAASVNLGGTLYINRDPSYTPTDGTSVVFLTFPIYQFRGDFDTILTPNNSWDAGGETGLGFTPVYAVSDYSLYVERQGG